MNTDSAIIVDRDVLYQEVWSTPGRKLAKKYGVSDVALAKACKRHEIPRPTRGHWVKIQCGLPVEQPALPPVSKPQLLKVRFLGGRKGATGFHDPEYGQSKPESAEPKIIVPDRLSSPHPLIEATRIWAKSTDPNRERRGDSPKDVVPIAASGPAMARALRILDALIKAWIESGGIVCTRLHGNHGPVNALFFGIGDDDVMLKMEEIQKYVPGSSGNRWDGKWQPTGLLVIELDHVWNTGLRRKWADGKRQRLEEVLNSILDGLRQRLAYHKKQRLNNEISSRQRRRALERREAGKRRAEQDEERRKLLHEHVDRWHQAQRIRQYLDFVEDAIQKGECRIKDEKVFNRWLSWSRWYADHINPLVRAEPIPEAPVAPSNKPVAEIEMTDQMRAAMQRLEVADSDAMYRLQRKDLDGFQTSLQEWNELCCILEGLGYDMHGRQYWL